MDLVLETGNGHISLMLIVAFGFLGAYALLHDYISGYNEMVKNLSNII